MPIGPFAGMTMTSMALVAVVLVVIVTAAAVGVRRARRRALGVRRDSPTTAAARPEGPRIRLGRVFRGMVDDVDLGRLEEALIAADVGVATATALVGEVRAARPADAAEAAEVLRVAMRAAFASGDRSIRLVGEPAVIVVLGVNGSGKTTTIAKLAARLLAGGHRVVLGAADTFRAAAADQLRVWGDRLGVDVVSGQAAADPAAVAFDAVAAGRARGCDVVIIDTAGRLHDKANLMAELEKMLRVVGRDTPPSEILMVLDGTTGQNGISQARAFGAVAGLTGVVVTKLDGTSRGGIVLAIERELGIPTKLVGVGEGSGDLRDFDPDAFVAGLLEE